MCSNSLRSGHGLISVPHASAVLQGEGDTVTARVLLERPGEVVIDSIEGDGGRLSLEAAKNCAGIAALETLKLLGQTSCGVSLRLHKVGLPISCEDRLLHLNIAWCRAVHAQTCGMYVVPVSSLNMHMGSARPVPACGDAPV